MQLKTYIFRWVLFATLIPVSALGLFSTYYLETLHTESLRHKGRLVLEKITLDLSVSFRADRLQIINLLESPAMHDYIPVLKTAAENRLHPKQEQLNQHLSQFFVQIQNIFNHFQTIRVLDINGNTLLKVSNSEMSPLRFEGLSAYPLMEPENPNPDFFEKFSNLSPNHVSFLNYSLHEENINNPDNPIPIQEAIVPIYNGIKQLGFLTVDISNRYEHLLSMAKLFPGQLLIAQIDSTLPDINGYILYKDKQSNNKYKNPFKEHIQYLQQLDQGVVWDAVNNQSYGYLASPSFPGHYHFIEFFPNPDALNSWVIASYSDDDLLYGPFIKIRSGFWALLVFAVLSALFLANSVARRISNPIKKLAKNFHIYAEGKKPEKTFSALAEIKQLAIAFDDMAATLDNAKLDRHNAEQRMIHSAKMASIGQMAAGIGHELNNPLNNMLSLSKLIQRELADAKKLTEAGKNNHDDLVLIDQDLESIQEEIERASKIIRGILNFARQLPDSRIGIFDINTLVGSCVELVLREAKQKHVNLNVISTEQEPQYTSGDFIKLQQAIINILQNAVFASFEKQNVDISISYSYEYAQILIRDYGLGFDEEKAEKLFDPFFTTKDIGQGTGLGLSIALGIIEGHGGQLNLQNVKDGKGALVTIYLPLVEPN